jgi:hypothetical protein
MAPVPPETPYTPPDPDMLVRRYYVESSGRPEIKLTIDLEFGFVGKKKNCYAKFSKDALIKSDLL